MKKVLLIPLVVSYFNMYGQEQTPAQSTEMDKLSALVGQWEGEGWIQLQNTRTEFKHTELVQRKLDGTTLLIEGKGYAEGNLVFEAMAVASYNSDAGKYRFNSFLADGKYTEASGEFNEDGSFEWSFKVANGGTVKYHIFFNPTSWHETGHYSPDNGNQWYDFMEMNLTRIINENGK